jgi:methylated-DNA-[protein]-cysteine S-methyltransferase
MAEQTDYMIALMPPPDLSEEIHNIRKEFSEKYNCIKALAPPVHITLQAPFKMDAGMEQAVIDILNPIAYYQEPFEVKMENFGAFPDNKVVFIAVEKHAVLRTFQRNLVSRLKKAEVPAVNYSMSFHPHITIGYRDIPAEHYEAARAEYEEKHFRGNFRAGSFFLWKRVNNKWTVLHEFSFLAEKKPENFTDLMESPLGLIEVVADHKNLLALNFLEAKGDVSTKPNRTTEKAITQLRQYFEGTLKDFDLPLAPEGTDFQQRIWELLVKVPFGEKISYQALSRRHGDEKAIRAVGLANGKNPIPIIIPCHRIIGSNGKLVGYSGGMWRKQWLLEHELKHSGIGQQMLFF